METVRLRYLATAPGQFDRCNINVKLSEYDTNRPRLNWRTKQPVTDADGKLVMLKGAVMSGPMLWVKGDVKPVAADTAAALLAMGGFELADPPADEPKRKRGGA